MTTRVEPMGDGELPAVCAFLNEHLNPAIAPQRWIRSFQQDWTGEKTNNGFLLWDDKRLVGVIGAIYSRQDIAGKSYDFCNINSWCVLPEYRSESLSLLMALLEQPGYHFTLFTPTQEGLAIYGFLQFRFLDKKLTVLPNLPRAWSLLTGVRVVREGLPEVLSDQAARDYLAHRHLPWLHHLAVGRPGRFCHVVYRRRILRSLPCAEIFHVESPGLFTEYFPLLGAYLLLRRGLFFSRIESRFLQTAPWPSLQQDPPLPKLLKGEGLEEWQATNLYTELAALDLD